MRWEKQLAIVFCALLALNPVFFSPSLREPINRPSAQPIHRPKMEYIVSGGGLYIATAAEQVKIFFIFLYILYYFAIWFHFGWMYCDVQQL